MGHLPIMCATIQYGPLVEQKNQFLRVEVICSTSSVNRISGLSLCHQISTGLVPCMHEWIDVHDRRRDVVLTGDECSVH